MNHVGAVLPGGSEINFSARHRPANVLLPTVMPREDGSGGAEI